MRPAKIHQLAHAQAMAEASRIGGDLLLLCEPVNRGATMRR
jgi:hypothetical protein